MPKGPASLTTGSGHTDTAALRQSCEDGGTGKQVNSDETPPVGRGSRDGRSGHLSNNCSCSCVEGPCSNALRSAGRKVCGRQPPPPPSPVLLDSDVKARQYHPMQIIQSCSVTPLQQSSNQPAPGWGLNAMRHDPCLQGLTSTQRQSYAQGRATRYVHKVCAPASRCMRSCVQRNTLETRQAANSTNMEEVWFVMIATDGVLHKHWALIACNQQWTRTDTATKSWATSEASQGKVNSSETWYAVKAAKAAAEAHQTPKPL